MSEQLHITGVIVHAQPPRCAAVGTAIAGIPQAQVHGTDPGGKLVVTLEASTAGVLLDQLSQIEQTPGVIGVAMVYQHVESLESLNKELTHGDHEA